MSVLRIVDSVYGEFVWAVHAAQGAQLAFAVLYMIAIVRRAVIAHDKPTMFVRQGDVVLAFKVADDDELLFGIIDLCGNFMIPDRQVFCKCVFQR